MASPLKIALVSDCYHPRLGGIELQVRDLGLRLSRLGHQVEVITTVPGDGVVDGLVVHRIDGPKVPLDAAILPGEFRRLGHLLDAGGYDVAHFHSGVLSPLAYGGARVSYRLGVPTVVTSHCIWGYATPGFRLLERRFRWSSWPVVFSAVSDVAAADIRTASGGRREVLVLPNGIDTADWQVQPAPRDPGLVTICSTMRLAARKRPRHLIPILAAVRDRLPRGVRLRAVIIGDGSERALVEQSVRRHGLTDVVQLPGTLSRDEIKGWLARSDIYVAPANLESFGIAALEARCAGVPVVAKRRTGIREFVEHGREGLLAETDDELVVNLAYLIREPQVRERIAQHNRTTVPSCDWDDVVKRNLLAYEAAAGLLG
jgi:glycosyltransferase involved in cell wall biosynthesis